MSKFEFYIMYGPTDLETISTHASREEAVHAIREYISREYEGVDDVQLPSEADYAELLSGEWNTVAAHWYTGLNWFQKVYGVYEKEVCHAEI